jgi:hypothetical protein
LAEKELAAAWMSLTGADPMLSATMRRLIHSPATVAFLKQHFPPAKLMNVDAKVVAALITELDSRNFDKRETAMRELSLLGERVRPALEKTLAAEPTLETKRRVQQLLEAMLRPTLPPEELQAIRGIEILERIATPEARAWLATLSEGDPFARRTREAAASLKRMAVK